MKGRKKGKGSGIRLWVLFLVTVLLLEGGLTVSAKGSEEHWAYENTRLCPGGMAFGIRFLTKGVLVVGFSPFSSEGKEVSPGEEAGLRIRDLVLAVNGVTVETVEDIASAAGTSGGDSIAFALKRNGKKVTVTVEPKRDDADGHYKTGVKLRDSMAGIGTVTYVDPATGAFGGLGHGIGEEEKESALPLLRGQTLKVKIDGVIKGKAGHPGEIEGFFLQEKTGIVTDNTHWGVFGVFNTLPEGLGEPIPLCSRYAVREGKAEILCTLGEGMPVRYAVRLSSFNRNGQDNKNFAVRVTDKALLEKSGGIIQGMSGSPILQDGKLVGAVTHVLVDDPAAGYGIFIENMLAAAEKAA